MSTMLAGRLHLETRTFAVEEVPVPVPGPGEVLVEVRAAGVCLSDVHLIDGSLSPFFPVDAVTKAGAVTLGHEVAGVVHTLGPDVRGDWAPGQRVVLQAGEACGDCAGCLRRMMCHRPLTRGLDYDGGWAQYTIAREDALLPIPDDLPFDQAAIIPDAVSTPYAAIIGTGAVRPAQAVGIRGAGGLGAHAVRLARMVGAAPIIAVDPLPSARERALAFGADFAFDPLAPDFAESVREATAGRGLDVAFDFAGVGAARAQAAAVLGPFGKLVLAGLTPEPVTIADSIGFCFNINEVRGHYGSEPEHVEQLVGLASAGRLDLAPSITAHVPLAEAADAVARLEKKIGDPIRLVLTP
ncbi:zinc-binding dehydrogenase [Streptomyces nymphaeiformis]|uniref:Threonine dehydrogenase-like Zn-dependent dehydrogenase n=1 Tax=Streptomyces nymphaeiformis TaxID=2663842 RepID=A0A7W7XFV6_9ACTN|nr:zinc-binding dehydrogenase [Streptomyces nymphaeiformis]MBB4986855.1 threonine dehydrogenase-like Zn-dependent dehydrogenase [Streptomyces nymphaeiformis]